MKNFLINVTIILVLLFLVTSIFVYNKKVEAPINTYTPSIEEPKNNYNKYKDLLTAKCYNEEEVEVSCKG